MKPVPCPCCDEPMEVNKSLKGKPTIHCPECALQMFIRGNRGVRLFQKRYGGEWTAAKGETPAEAAPAAATTPAARGATSGKKGKQVKGSKAAKVGPETGKAPDPKPGADPGPKPEKFFLE